MSELVVIDTWTNGVLEHAAAARLGVSEVRRLALLCAAGGSADGFPEVALLREALEDQAAEVWRSGVYNDRFATIAIGSNPSQRHGGARVAILIQTPAEHLARRQAARRAEQAYR